MIAYHLYALALISTVLGLAAVRRCSLYSPLVINAMVWLVVFIMGLLFHERFYQLQEKAFIAWLIWFMVTSIIFFLLYPSRPKSTWVGTETRRIPMDYTLPRLLLIVWLGYRIWIVGSTGPEDFFLNLRWSSLGAEGFVSYGLIRRFYPIIFALFLFEHVYARRENRRLRLILWLWMLLYAVSTMGKIQILVLVLSWVIIQGMKGEMNVKRIVIPAAVVSVLMMFNHLIRGGLSYASTIEDFLALYVYSPLVAFGYMDIDRSMPFGAYPFRFFYAIGNILGIAPEPVSNITPYVEVPAATNVYTILYLFYYDFGMLGVLLHAVVYGIIFSCLYLLSVKRGGLWLVLFSGYSIVLVGQFIVDLLITTFSGNLQFLIYALAVFLVSRRVCYVR